MSVSHQAVIDELRLSAGGPPPTMRELRQQLDCSAAHLASAVQALRYQGKLDWDRLALSPSMLAGREPAEEGGGEDPAMVNAPPPSITGPDDTDDYPGEVNDHAAPAPPAQASSGLVPRETSVKAGVHAAQTRAANKPLPAPSHEPEIARLVREEVNESSARRTRARSTGTVRQPLELRKFGVPDLSLREGVTSLLVEDPHDLIVAIGRKHADAWRRVILLGRARGERPAEALYAALEAGLSALERSECANREVA